MSAVAGNSTLARRASFYSNTIGKKVVMAVTGVILFGFIIGHMAGNLQFFLGPEKLDAYAENLRHVPALLWGVRSVLLVAVVLHIVSSISLGAQSSSRPPRWLRAQKRTSASTYASRTMYWSGPIILAFLIYHLLHLTFGTVHPHFQDLRPYENLVDRLLESDRFAVAYIVSIVLLGMHLYHGLWSMFQTLGVAYPRYTPN